MSDGTHDGRPKGSKCAAITRGGKPCPTAALPGRPWCWAHDPEALEAKREAGRRGGHARSTAARARAAVPAAMDAAELGGWLTALFKGVMTGRIEPKIGTAAATIARTMMEVRELVEVEARLVALEEAASLGERRVS